MEKIKKDRGTEYSVYSTVQRLCLLHDDSGTEARMGHAETNTTTIVLTQYPQMTRG